MLISKDSLLLLVLPPRANVLALHPTLMMELTNYVLIAITHVQVVLPSLALHACHVEM
jgi:hypothetical protein